MDNDLRAIRFCRPGFIPMKYVVNSACWHHYDFHELCDFMLERPFLFPGFRSPSAPYQPVHGVNARCGQPFCDVWGCTWATSEDGITGAVVGHPLADWVAFSSYRGPDPAQTDGLEIIDWEKVRGRLVVQRQAGRMVQGALPHGHTFLRLLYLRGYENLMYDFADGEPRIERLVEMVEAFNRAVVERYLGAGAQMFAFPEDLGMQRGPMLSPEHFARYIQPSYHRLMTLVHEHQALVHMHSDGDIRALAGMILRSGVDIFNLQDHVNGLDWIRRELKGRVCIELDIDRQSTSFTGTPAGIDAMIREEVATLGSPEGGLMMIYGLYPGVPMENARAVADAMIRYAGYFN